MKKRPLSDRCGVRDFRQRVILILSSNSSLLISCFKPVIEERPLFGLHNIPHFRLSIVLHFQGHRHCRDVPEWTGSLGIDKFPRIGKSLNFLQFVPRTVFPWASMYSLSVFPSYGCSQSWKGCPDSRKVPSFRQERCRNSPYDIHPPGRCPPQR